MAEGLIKRGADLIRVLEAMYSPEPEGEAWMRGVVEATDAALEGPSGTGLNLIAYEDGYARPAVVSIVTTEGWLTEVFRDMSRLLGSLSPESLRTFYFPNQPFATHSALEPGLPASVVQDLRTYRALARIEDACGVFTHPEPGLAGVLCWGKANRSCVPARGDMPLFQSISGHLDSAIRLRTRPEQVVAAVLGPDGDLLDLDEAALEPRRALLAARVTRLERSRLRARRTEPDAASQWEALVDGRYTLVPREDRDGRRYYLLVLNPPGARGTAALSPREEQVLRLAARGFSGKASAYALGVSQGVVSESLARAARKLGLRSRLQLAHVASSLFGPRRRDEAEVDALTDAEREVLSLLRRGLSNAEIARLRERSVRTVANQVASLLAKTGATTRRALAAGARSE